MSNQGKEVVLCIIKNKNGKILILERTHIEVATDGSGNKLSWVFPGGKPKENETLEEAVVRETKQETGYNILVKRLISKRNHPQFPVHLSYYECELKDLKVKAISDIHEVARVKWIDPKELKEYFTTDIDRGVAKYLGI